MKRLLPGAIAVVALLALLVYTQQTRESYVVSGTIEVDEVRVGSRVGGRVAEVNVREGQTVTAGMWMVKLEPFALNEQLAAADQTLAAAEAEYQMHQTGFRDEDIEQARAARDESKAALEELQNGPRPQEIAAAEAQLMLAQAELKNAEQNFQRAEKLFRQGASNQEEFDAANTQQQVAAATVVDRQARVDLLHAGTRAEEIAQAQARLRQAEQALKLKETGYRPEEIDESRARRSGAEADVMVIQRQLDELTVQAPCDGIVSAVDLLPGDLVSPNAPVITLLDTRHYYVRAYIPESALSIQTGSQIEVSIDGFPGERFKGEVTFVARQAEFTPGNVQTPEERSKQVFRIRIELKTDLDRLRPGMGADVHLDSVESK